MSAPLPAAGRAPSQPLLEFAVRYCAQSPVDGAHLLEGLDAEPAIEVLESLTPAHLRKLLPNLSPAFASAIVAGVPAARVAPVLESGGAEVCAAILLSLPDQRREAFLAALPDPLRDHIHEFLTFPESSTGQVMTTDYLAFRDELSVSETVAQLKRRAKAIKNPSNVFVVDANHKLLGVVALRDLVVAADETKLHDIMVRDVISVGPFDEASTALQTLSGRGFTTLPVVDAQGHLLGVVRATQLLADAQAAASQNLQKLFGVGRDERAFSPVGFCLKKRLPWLHINLATAFMAAAVVAVFEGIIAKITVLAIYLPVVAGQGGNAGAQSLAVVMRGLVMREIPDRQVKRLLWKESMIGMVNGLVIGLVTAGIAWAWNGNPYLGIVIGLAMIANLTIAGLAGAAIPVLMKRLGLDPAQSSSIVLTTVTDVAGFFSFLGLAVIMQDYLI